MRVGRSKYRSAFDGSDPQRGKIPDMGDEYQGVTNAEKLATANGTHRPRASRAAMPPTHRVAVTSELFSLCPSELCPGYFSVLLTAYWSVHSSPALAL